MLSKQTRGLIALGCNPNYYSVGVHVCMCMVRKQRVETYLHPDTVAQVEMQAEKVSQFVREAVNEKLEREQE